MDALASVDMRRTMSDKQSLHLNTLTGDAAHAVREQWFGHPDVLQLECQTLMASTNAARGPRL
ncbi:hypothetical protein CAL65_17145 [Alkalilimnicola ehrlichii]|uniref:Uncharacterized protein n=2 Tax=Alkalilimnicola ehrlichii TaxID=351052 RepID=A0A3E0WL94_9GAMM|nr:hypothetical protein CAL65_17145 [Alkalilimnicola ehrlichii]